MSRRLVQPVRVIDEADQRLLLGYVGEQAQHSQPDEEAVRRVAGHQPERRSERIALRPGKSIEPLQHRPAQLVQTGVGQLHLRLDARSSRYAAP